MRGRLTDKVQAKAMALFGREISSRELRFMPYVNYCLTNDESINRRKVTEEEMKVLRRWEKDEWVVYRPQEALVCTRKFWDDMCELIWLAYVNHEKEN